MEAGFKSHFTFGTFSGTLSSSAILEHKSRAAVLTEVGLIDTAVFCWYGSYERAAADVGALSGTRPGEATCTNPV